MDVFGSLLRGGRLRVIIGDRGTRLLENVDPIAPLSPVDHAGAHDRDRHAAAWCLSAPLKRSDELAVAPDSDNALVAEGNDGAIPSSNEG